jgi:hypothetical protein
MEIVESHVDETLANLRRERKIRWIPTYYEWNGYDEEPEEELVLALELDDSPEDGGGYVALV